MSHRIRKAVRDDNTVDFGAGVSEVEVDETYIGRDKERSIRRGYGHKLKVMVLADRETPDQSRD